MVRRGGCEGPLMMGPYIKFNVNTIDVNFINHKVPQVHGCLDKIVARAGRTHRDLIKETFRLKKLIH